MIKCVYLYCGDIWRLAPEPKKSFLLLCDVIITIVVLGPKTRRRIKISFPTVATVVSSLVLQALWLDFPFYCLINAIFFPRTSSIWWGIHAVVEREVWRVQGGSEKSRMGQTWVSIHFLELLGASQCSGVATAGGGGDCPSWLHPGTE